MYLQTVLFIPMVSSPIHIDHLASYRQTSIAALPLEQNQSLKSSESYWLTELNKARSLASQVSTPKCSWVDNLDLEEKAFLSCEDLRMTKTRGRPRKSINTKRLIDLKIMGLTNAQIAKDLNTTERQIYRILKSLRGGK